MKAQRVTADDEDDDLIAARDGSAGIIRLNRPKTLNAITLHMARSIMRALDEFQSDPGVATILLEGAGERGLCAGGDIRKLYDEARAGSDFGKTYWREEYALDARIAAFGKPFIAYMDGLVMGGGIGLSGHASFRLVTERTKLAMPEVSLGFFPDVGGTWLLSHAPGEIGTYYALTGNAMDGAGAIYTGFADTQVRSADWPALRAAAAKLPRHARADDVRALVERFAVASGPAAIAAHRGTIDACFHFDTVEEIVAALEHDGSQFARDTLAAIQDKSPRGLKVALQLLRLGRSSSSLEECLIREYRAALEVLASADFVEGIRAAIIDKDRNPQWSPARIEDVTPQIVARYLAPRGQDELIL